MGALGLQSGPGRLSILGRPSGATVGEASKAGV